MQSEINRTIYTLFSLIKEAFSKSHHILKTPSLNMSGLKVGGKVGLNETFILIPKAVYIHVAFYMAYFP